MGEEVVEGFGFGSGGDSFDVDVGFFEGLEFIVGDVFGNDDSFLVLNDVTFD